MDNPQEIINTLEGTIDRLKVVYVENGRVPLNENIAEVRQLCLSVEEVLRHNQKDKVSFWGDRRDYWNYLSEVVSKMKGLDSCVKKVQGLTQLTTGQGKGRAFIRECLTEQLLADCIQNSVSNKKRTKEWYHSSSILLTESFSQRMLNALYDLSEVTFDLPSEGLDLDETWPAFVLKSFQKQNGTPQVQNHNPAMSPLLKVLVSGTQVAMEDNMDKPRVSVLERAIEEEPCEIYVHQEIPFDLDMVASLLADIQKTLAENHSHKNYTHFKTSPLPELKVSKMDDITSCLNSLKHYITSWSHELSSKSTKWLEENKTFQDRHADLEMQLRETYLESDNSETDLINQLQTSRDDLKVVSSEAQRLAEESKRLTLELSQAREKQTELEVMNFDLEEQLMRSGSENVEDNERGRAYTIMESSLQEKDQEMSELTLKLKEAELQNQQLERDMADARTRLENQGVIHETHLKMEESMKDLRDETQALERKEEALEEEKAKLLEENESLMMKLKTLKGDMELEWRSNVERERNKLVLVEQERDRIKAELAQAYDLVEDETSSIKFKLSTQNIELQKNREQSSKKDRTIAELRSLTKNLESQIGEMTERCEGAELQVEELKLELQDVELVLHNQQDEMMSLNEQLTEKTLGRDQERASILKLQTERDFSHNQQVTEMREKGRQVDRLTNENEDLRKAIKKLLEQKVTLWQHADDLEQEQTAMGVWIDSKSVTNCMSCDMAFTVFVRKHHCRSCGKVFCTKCCEKKLQLAITKDPARVCDNCFNRIVTKRTPFASSVINAINPDDFLRQPDPPGSSLGEASSDEPRQGGIRTIGLSSNSLNIERSIGLGGNSLQAKLLLQNHNSDLGEEEEDEDEEEEGDRHRNQTHSHSNSHDTTEKDGEISSEGEETPVKISSFSSGDNTDDRDFQPSSYDSMEYSVDPEIRQREAERSRQTDKSLYSISTVDYHVSSVQGETIDESYCLIDTQPEEESFPIGIDHPGTLRGLDVNALASKLATLEDGDDGVVGGGGEGVRGEGQRRRISNRSGRVGCPDVTEVMMEGGGVHRVLVQIEKLGTAIVWEFSTEPKGIAFGVCYKDTKESEMEDEVLPLKRCVSHKATLTGEYCAQKKGFYVLKFDNCHSKYSGRKLMYKVWTKQPN